MKKLLIYKNGSRYVLGGSVELYPADVKPEKEIDLENLTLEQIEKIRRNPKDDKLINELTKSK